MTQNNSAILTADGKISSTSKPTRCTILLNYLSDYLKLKRLLPPPLNEYLAFRLDP